jgi:chemotaxis protein MotB
MTENKSMHPPQQASQHVSRRTSRRASGRRSAPAESAAGNHHDRWLISYADLATLLFSLFVVLYAAADHDRAQAVADALASQISGKPSSAKVQLPALFPGGRGVLPGNEAMFATREAVEKVLMANESLNGRARVTTVERGFVVSLTEAGFFAAGEAAMSEDARALINTVADTLRESHTLIRVEGHTDSLPIATARYPSNWELSSARASAVLAQLVAQDIAPARLSVAGYASERPVAGNDTPEGRALNRRVDLVILQTNK